MEDLSLSEVRRVARDLVAKYPELGTRIDKAVAIIGCRDVEHVGDNLWRVGSWAERENTYYVCIDAVAPATVCQCIDSSGTPGAKGRAPLGRCKHWIAATIVAFLTQRAPDPKPASDVDILYGRPEQRNPNTYQWTGHDGADWSSSHGLRHLAGGRAS